MAPSSCSNTPLPQCDVNITPQDEPLWLTTLVPPVRNQSILQPLTK